MLWLGPSNWINFLLKKILWSIVDLQCCLSFRYMVEWISYIYTYLLYFGYFSHIDHYRVLSRDLHAINCVNRSLLVIYFTYSSVYMCVCQALSPDLPPPLCTLPNQLLAAHFVTDTSLELRSQPDFTIHMLRPSRFLQAAFSDWKDEVNDSPSNLKHQYVWWLVWHNHQHLQTPTRVSLHS